VLLLIYCGGAPLTPLNDSGQRGSRAARLQRGVADGGHGVVEVEDEHLRVERHGLQGVRGRIDAVVAVDDRPEVAGLARTQHVPVGLQDARRPDPRNHLHDLPPDLGGGLQPGDRGTGGVAVDEPERRHIGRILQSVDGDAERQAVEEVGSEALGGRRSKQSHRGGWRVG